MLARSRRVVLRRLDEGDLRDFQAYRRDQDVSRFQSWTDITDDAAREFLARMSEESAILRPGKWTQIAVAWRDQDRILSDMGLHMSEDETEVEIGITLALRAR